MITRLAKRIAQQHIELRYPQQPLRLQPDYGERNAADFLGDRNVARNTGYGENIKPGPGNAFDNEVVADDLDLTLAELDELADFDASEVESFEIVDDMGITAEMWKESRLPSRRLNPDSVVDAAIEKWKKDNPEVAEKFEEEKVHSKEEMEQKLKLSDEIIDDIGLGRTASRSELEILRDINDVYSQLSPERLYQDGERSRGSASRVEARLYKRIKKLFKELGRQVSEYDAMIELRELEGGRTAKDHEESGSYMSRQNLREMSDMADFIVDDIGLEGLDDWVEDKISQSYAALNDVARYRGYRDDHPHGDDSDSSGFKFADDEIIDDMGIAAEFDKESRIKSNKHHSKKDVEKSMKEHGLDKNPEWQKYEGCMTPKGLDPACMNKNKSQGGGGLSALDRLGPAKKKPSGGGLDALSRLANDYGMIIDDLEW